MFNPQKPASPFANLQQPQGGQGGQYGANANPNGNGWGQSFMQQYGAPPGQMRDQWQQFRQDNGFGQPSMQPQQPTPPNQMPPQMPGPQNPWQSWLGQRPDFGNMAPGMDRMSMIRAWLAQRPSGGLLGQ